MLVSHFCCPHAVGLPWSCLEPWFCSVEWHSRSRTGARCASVRDMPWVPVTRAALLAQTNNTPTQTNKHTTTHNKTNTQRTHTISAPTGGCVYNPSFDKTFDIKTDRLTRTNTHIMDAPPLLHPPIVFPPILTYPPFVPPILA